MRTGIFKKTKTVNERTNKIRAKLLGTTVTMRTSNDILHHITNSQLYSVALIFEAINDPAYPYAMANESENISKLLTNTINQVITSQAKATILNREFNFTIIFFPFIKVLNKSKNVGTANIISDIA